MKLICASRTKYSPIFSELVVEVGALGVNGVAGEANFIKNAIPVLGPLLCKLAASIRFGERTIAGIDLFALCAAASRLFRPNDVLVNWMVDGDGDVAAFAARRQNGVRAAVVVMRWQACRWPILWQYNCDVAEVGTMMQRRV